jgi:tetratricopeptide (TPR) repeat protein
LSFREQIKASKAIGAKNYDAAIDTYKKMLDEHKEDYFATSMLAFCYEWKGDIAQAITYADKFLTRFPDDLEMLLLSARYWAQSGDEEKTYQFVRRALENSSVKTHKIPKWSFKLMKPLSFFKKFRGLEEKAEKDEQTFRKNREEQLNRAKQYRAWFESNKQLNNPRLDCDMTCGGTRPCFKS